MGQKIIYTLVEKRVGENGQEVKTYWHESGYGYDCRDGSVNFKLDLFPGITFNMRVPKSNGEAESSKGPMPQKTPETKKPENQDDDIPF